MDPESTEGRSDFLSGGLHDPFSGWSLGRLGTHLRIGERNGGGLAEIRAILTQSESHRAGARWPQGFCLECRGWL